MSKSLTFIILSLLVVASTENIHISSTSTGQESNSATSPGSGKCSGLTLEECFNADYTIVYN